MGAEGGGGGGGGGGEGQRSTAAPVESYKWVWMWAGWSMSTFISWRCSSGRTGDTALQERSQCEFETVSASYRESSCGL